MSGKNRLLLIQGTAGEKPKPRISVPEILRLPYPERTTGLVATGQKVAGCLASVLPAERATGAAMLRAAGPDTLGFRIDFLVRDAALRNARLESRREPIQPIGLTQGRFPQKGQLWPANRPARYVLLRGSGSALNLDQPDEVLS